MMPQQPDSLRATLDSVFARPEYRWRLREDPFARIKHLLTAVRQWIFDLQDTHPLGFRAVVYVLGAFVLAIVAHAAWNFFRSVQSTESAADGTGSGFVPRDQEWYRAEADRLAGTGKYTEAIQADFLALVMALDARRVLRFHPSKTPAEYARDASLPPGPRAEFAELVRRLYRYAFARTPCGPEEFAQWRASARAERYAPAN